MIHCYMLLNYSDGATMVAETASLSLSLSLCDLNVPLTDCLCCSRFLGLGGGAIFSKTFYDS